jgi:hypothetical protein
MIGRSPLMLMSKGLISSTSRAVALATIAALVLTTSESPVVAAPAVPASRDMPIALASSYATDFSAARRHRHYHRRGNAAGAAFAGMAFGMIAGAIAAQQRREYYENYGYYYAPGYYYGSSYYYGGPYYYGRRYYYPPY